MIRRMIITDYEKVFDLWKSTDGMGLRTLDDSQQGIATFLKRNPTTKFVAIDNDEIIGTILCGHDGRRGYIYHTVVKKNYRGDCNKIDRSCYLCITRRRNNASLFERYGNK